MAFHTSKELEMLGLAEFCDNVLISNKASIYNTERISIGAMFVLMTFVFFQLEMKGLKY